MMLREEVLQPLIDCIKSLPLRDQLIFSERNLKKNPLTHDQIGRKYHLSREGVRLLLGRTRDSIAGHTSAIEKHIEEVLERHIEPIDKPRDLRVKVIGVTPNSAHLLIHLLYDLTVRLFNYEDNNGYLVRSDIAETIESTKCVFKKLMDDVGLVEESKLKEILDLDLNEKQWIKFTRLLRLHRYYGFLSKRRSDKSKFKAFLMQSGEPKEVKVLSRELGVPPKRVVSTLSNIEDVKRVGRYSWTYAVEDIAVYKGIERESIAFIGQWKNKTAPLETVVERVSENLGCKPESVRLFLRTPQFIRDAHHVKVASRDEVELKELEEVIDGRTPSGRPYKDFRISPRHFRGYSLISVPHEFGLCLGCELNDKTHVAVVNLPHFTHQVNVQNLLGSTTIGAIGNILPVLEYLQVKAGESLRVAIVGPKMIAITRLIQPDLD